MNIKQFLIFKACDVLPPELKYYILEFVQNEAATCIQRSYTFKISKNIDIFREIMNISSGNNQCSYVNDYLKYAMNNITYTYIQEPGTWIDYLEDLILIYGDNEYFNIDIIDYILNSIKNSNVMYKNTGIEYWSYY